MQRSKSSQLVILMIAALSSVVPAVAQRGDDAERASKNGKTEGSVEGVDVTLEYGRPNVKSREIWGGLVPYDKVWRSDLCLQVDGVSFVSAAVVKPGERLTFNSLTFVVENEMILVTAPKREAPSALMLSKSPVMLCHSSIASAPARSSSTGWAS